MADQALSELTVKIRREPGFHGFLRPPAKEELMAAATEGPVVMINLSEYRCDALLIQRDSITALELPGLSVADVEERVRALDKSGFLRGDILSPTLEWMWEVITRSCLDALGFSEAVPAGNGNWPRVCWAIPVPLYRYGARPCYVVPCLVGEIFDPRAEPSQCVDDVLEQLRQCAVFHFADRGFSDSRYTSESYLMLEDWQSNALTVEDLRGSHFLDNSPFLGYLSACSPGADEASALIDESVHLMSSLQLAGFRHVVGTLWEVSDEHCVEVARVFYETLRDEERTDAVVCWGLHLATKTLRDRELKNWSGPRKGFSLRPGGVPKELRSFHWIPYIYFGV